MGSRDTKILVFWLVIGVIVFLGILNTPADHEKAEQAADLYYSPRDVR